MCDVPDDVIFNIIIYTDDTILYSKYDQASDLWQQLELVAARKSTSNCGLGKEVAC